MRVGLVVLCGLVGLAGCGGGTSGGSGTGSGGVQSGGTGAKLTGVVRSGQQAVAGARVYLLGASATGYGGAGIAASASNASVSLMTSGTGASQDSSGATNGDWYVTTDSGGNFSIAGNYNCAAGQQVYLYTVGGNEGAGANAAIGMMAALGNCPTTAVSAVVNEVSTVAAAYAMAGFATDATHVGSSGTALALTGIANAFANAGNLETLGTGAGLALTPAGNGTVPLGELNTLANVLVACVNSSGAASGACSTLFANAESATDTASAAINIAHNPGVNVAALYGLGAANALFAGGLTSAPNDWTVALDFTGGGLSHPVGLAIDGAGSAWQANSVGNCVSKFSNLGAALSPAGGFTTSGLTLPNAVAIDPSGNAYVTSSTGVYQFLSSGSAGWVGTTTGTNNYGIAVDGAGNVWTTQYDAGSFSERSNTGTLIPPAAGIVWWGYGYVTHPYGIALDGMGNVWVNDPFGFFEAVKFTNTGTAIAQVIGIFAAAAEVAIDHAGNAWFPGSQAAVYEVSSTGSPAGAALTGGGISDPAAVGGNSVRNVAIDGAGNVWLSNYGANVIAELTNAGVALSPATGYQGGLAAPLGIGVDGSGDVWVANSGNNTVTEFVGAGVPVVTPLAVGVKNNALGTRP